jgi:hypothetical protein
MSDCGDKARYMADELLFLWQTYGCSESRHLTDGAKELRREIRRVVKHLNRRIKDIELAHKRTGKSRQVFKAK